MKNDIKRQDMSVKIKLLEEALSSRVQ